jgi:hypothetical protein
MISQMGFCLKRWPCHIKKLAWGIPANFLVPIR